MFSDPVAIREARTAADVRACLREVDLAVRGRGLFAAGFIAYEAAQAFGFRTHPFPAGELPLAWFALFPPGHVVPAQGMDAAIAALETGGPGVDASVDTAAGLWSPSIEAAGYGDRVRAIKRHIAAGDTYQINFTFRLRAPFHGRPLSLFERLHDAQRGLWSGYIDLGRHVILSGSPELFFVQSPGHILTEPMKGTGPRGLSSEEDRKLGLQLRRSGKNRAENVMIVDVVRNDLGRVAAVGSVRVPDLFRVNRYPNVWQMTSRVTARSPAPFTEILEALFPAASVTGAPKIRAAEIIHALEDSPRGVYTGAVGCIAPGGLSQFNVAIRTIVVDRRTAVAEFGVGSGIVWDSREEDEHAECLLKAEVLTAGMPVFELLETLAWTPAGGFVLLDRHLQRLRLSAAYFGFTCDRASVVTSLHDSVAHADGPRRVRLLLRRDGATSCTAEPLAPVSPRTLRVMLAETPVDSREVWLYHKTTKRSTYERARATMADRDEVILWNTAHEITEGTVTNVVVEIDGRKLTPPVRCGLLPGTFRAEMLARGEISERRITITEFRSARRVWVANSVWGMREAEVVG